jgi:GTP-binding protein
VYTTGAILASSAVRLPRPHPEKAAGPDSGSSVTTEELTEGACRMPLRYAISEVGVRRTALRYRRLNRRATVMTHPVVAIVGRPNVGKSRLFNRLIGQRRALVGNLPGVTRDRNYATAEFDERRFLLVDTGGFHVAPADPLMEQIILQVRVALEEADAVLFVLDGIEGLAPVDREIDRFLRKTSKPVYHVINKVDGSKQEEGVCDFYELGAEHLFTISAEHGRGIDDLMHAVVQLLPSTEPAPVSEATHISVLGKPNAGKSTLINALIGEKRLIASQTPGTTRDTIDTPFTWGGHDFILIDTAGIRRKSRITDRIETVSVIKAFQSIDGSDVCLVLIDATEGITEQDARIAGLVHEAGRASIVLINKWDAMPRGSNRRRFDNELRQHLKFMDYAPTLFISALTGAGLGAILPLAIELAQTLRQRISTSAVNQALRKAVSEHAPAVFRGRRVKFFYGTQGGTAPPTFLLFVNEPKGVHFSYRRFLINRFREELNLPKVPLRIILRKRN